MTFVRYITYFLSLITPLVNPALASNKKPITPETLISLDRVSSATISPDGKYIAYVLKKIDIEADKGKTDIWITRISDKKAFQLTTHNTSAHSPKWSKNSERVYFISKRDKKSQIWRINIHTKKVRQVTNFSIDVTSFKLSPDNKSILFSASVFPSCDNFKCTEKKYNALKSKKETGVIFNKMFVRHWDRWIDKTQSQLFLVKINQEGTVGNSPPIAISKLVNANVPSAPFGSDREYNFSNDGSFIYFSARLQDANEPTSTNFDIYRVSTTSPTKAINLTKANLAWDTQPVLSHDGSKLAYLAMRRPGFEADRFEVIIRDLRTGINKKITQNWDRSFDTLQFSKDDKYLYLTGNNLGTTALWKFEISTGRKILFNKNGSISNVTLTKNNVLFSKDSLTSPKQLFITDLNGKSQRQLTYINQAKLDTIKFGQYEQFQFKGWNNELVYGYVVKPANYIEGNKYPLVYLIHGGPQGSFSDRFHYRWNPQTYAAEGFVAVMIDFHGSTGYGQKFTDSISGNWGSKPFEDLQKGLAFVVDKYSFIDGNNICALGASYGGYMINWFAGNWPDRFKCLVNHAGVFDNRMMYYATEELWFVEWENDGPYFKSPKKHERYNPVSSVNNWKTPMLVIHGELDYRVPVTQSLGTFTALQRKGIKSKLLVFPNENHWILNPSNSIQWHNEVNQWLHEFLKAED